MTSPVKIFTTHKLMVLMVWLGLICIFCLPSNSLAANRILNIRHWVAPDHTRIVIDTREAARYQVVKEGQVLSLYFRNCDMQESIPNAMLLKKRGIEKILHEPVGSRRYKVDFFLDEKVETTVFNLKKVEDKPYRIVIDIKFPDVEKKEVEERAQARVQQRHRIIVIDPGHGGDDPGAVGNGGTYEKDVVLEISRKLKAFLNQQQGYRAFLTREGDYYVPFKKRMQIAREYGAAMFISVHADAAPNREARGSSVYCLSLGGASSVAARIIASKENLADLIGGSPNGESSEASDPIILNMCQTNTLNLSRNFGTVLLDSLGGVGHVKFRAVQEADFRVLKLPEIPSVLVETAYISNSEEEELLKDYAFQLRIAEAMGKAICNFEPSIPLTPSITPAVLVRNERDTKKAEPFQSPLAPVSKKVSLHESKDENPPTILFHKVKRGETLQKIALRYDIPLADLARLNTIRIQDPLLAGKKLKIAKLANAETSENERTAANRNPVSPRIPEKEKDRPSFHKVRRGETLDAIARQYGTSLANLLKINGMTMKDPLFAGAAIKVKGDETANRGGEDGAGNITRRIAKNSQAVRSSSRVASVSSYEVKKGDSLDSIAREHNTTLSALMELNSMKRTDKLLAGTKIRLPESASSKELKETKTLSSVARPVAGKKKGELITYKVKRGDTLDTIARKYKTRIDVLLSLNNMKLTDPLYANQPLKLPGDSSFF